VKIISRGRVCSIVLIDNENKIFAVCYASEDGAVERTLDSGRYFVLRITNQQGRHAFIGIAFNERNDAFDFNVTLSEFKNEIEREDQANKLTLESSSSSAIVQPLKDMSLKDGEKIKIKLTSSSKKKNDENPAGIGNKLTLLPPPRGGATTSTASTAPTASTALKASPTLNNSPSIKSSQPIFNADPFNSDPFSTDPFSASSSNAQSSTNVFSFGSASSSASSLLSSDPFSTKSDPFASNNDPFSSNSDPFQTTTTTTGTATTSYHTSNNKQSSSTSSSSSSNLLDF
jgi:hypothetical protein